MISSRIWIAGTAIVVVAVIALGWFLGIAPQLDAAAKSASETASVEAANATHEQELLALQKQFEEIGSLRKELAAASSSIPSTASLPDFILQVNSIAKKVGVEVTTLNTGEAALFVPPEDAPKDGPASLVQPERFILVPITVKAVGSFSDILKFSDGLQSGDRLFFVEKFSAARKDAAAPVEGEVAAPTGTVFEGEMSGYIYVLLSPELDALLNAPEAPAEEEPAEEEPEPAASEEPAPVETPAGEETPAAEETPAVEETPAP